MLKYIANLAVVALFAASVSVAGAENSGKKVVKSTQSLPVGIGAPGSISGVAVVGGLAIVILASLSQSSGSHGSNLD